MSMPKMRGHLPQKKFADAARAARGAGNGGQRFKRPEGAFNRLKLSDKPTWIRFSPDQLYAQQLYDRDAKMIIETGTPDYPARPWFEHVGHFVIATKRPISCSSGPDRMQPCRGCAIRKHFFDHIKDMDVERGDKRPEPPVQVSTRYSMACTVLEKIFEMPVLDKKGQPKKNKDGVTMTNYVPAPLSGFTPMQQKANPGEFGMNFHWGFGPMHLSQLASIDTDLWNSCANCAEPLMAVAFNCADCGHVVYTDDTGVTGADLRTMREQSMKCPHCSHEGYTLPDLRCTGCESPAEGNLLSFDLRLKLEKDMNDDKKSVIQLVQFRLPDYEALAATIQGANANRIFEMVYAPLDVVAINAPDSIEAQAWSLPDGLKDIDPSYHLVKKEAAPYGHVEEDPDQMSFGD